MCSRFIINDDMVYDSVKMFLLISGIQNESGRCGLKYYINVDSIEKENATKIHSFISKFDR